MRHFTGGLRITPVSIPGNSIPDPLGDQFPHGGCMMLRGFSSLLRFSRSCIHGMIVCFAIVLTVPPVTAGGSEFTGSRDLLSLDINRQTTSSAESKIDSRLLQLMDERFLPPLITRSQYADIMEETAYFEPDRTQSSNQLQIEEGTISVYVYLSAESTISSIDPFVGEVTDRDESNHLAVVRIKIRDILPLAELPEVRCIRPVLPPVLYTGSVNSEGDGVHQTDDVRSTYGEDGTGFNVGIISNGVDTRSSAQSSGDLPADGSGLTVLSNSIGGDEGTAMLEIVYDLAPGAGLYFHDMGLNTIQFNSAIDDLVTAGCDVICDDVGWIQQPFFEDGSVASHVASVIAGNEIVYVSSAGNAGNSHYQGGYYPIPSSTQHDFSEGGGDYYLYANIPSGSTLLVITQWNDQFGSASNDYNLYLYSFTTSGWVAGSTNDQAGGYPDPIEVMQYTANGTTAGDFAVVVDLASGSAKTLEVYLYAYDSTGIYTNNIDATDAIFGHAAVVDAIAVGAVSWSTPTTLESFSSCGPTTISFGTRAERDKPDVVGCDMVSVTGAGGFPSTFGGTSAAAPHISAVVAQLWGASPSSSAGDIRTMLRSSSGAVDCGSSGYDHDYGWGRSDAMMLYTTYVPVELVSFSGEWSGEEIVVRWSTASEDDNLGFNVYRENDSDTHRIQINPELIPGAGTTAESHDYTFSDTDVQAGSIYRYWLEQVDVNGKTELFGPVTVESSPGQPRVLSLMLSPNPVRDSARLELSLPGADVASVSLYDVNGRQIQHIWNGTVDETGCRIEWKTDTFSPGTYFIRATSSFGSVSRKVILR